MPEPDSILTRWGITEGELTELVDRNPSLRGILLGYVAEKKFHDRYLSAPDIAEASKDDDHDRSKKGDRRIRYKGRTYLIEVKSLQTNSVKQRGPDEWFGKTQVDASDSRVVRFEDGSSLKTTCLLRGEFDVLAVNCFAFGNAWRFAFALNDELPANIFRKYTEEQQANLLPTLIAVTWPLQPPFTENLIELLERLVAAGRGR